MSVLSREAQREHIKQIMILLDTRIRADLLLATEENMAQSTPNAASRLGRTGHVALATMIPVDAGPPRDSGETDDEYLRPLVQTPEPESAINLAPRPVPDADQNMVLSEPNNLHTVAQDDHQTSLDQSSAKGRAIERSTRERIPMTPISEGKSIHTAFRVELDESRHNDRIGPLFPVGGSALSRIAIGLRHVRTGRDLPKDTFRDSSPEDLSVLDDLYHGLSWMLHAIDRQITVAVNKATPGFDQHISYFEAPSAPTKNRPRFKGQEPWQTIGGKKIRWDPDADWGSDRVWTEVEVKPEETAQKYVSSKLRHSYIPWEATWSPGESPSEEDEGEHEKHEEHYALSMWW